MVKNPTEKRDMSGRLHLNHFLPRLVCHVEAFREILELLIAISRRGMVRNSQCKFPVGNVKPHDMSLLPEGDDGSRGVHDRSGGVVGAVRIYGFFLKKML